MADTNGGIVGKDNPVQVQAEQITTFNSSGKIGRASCRERV